jgi:hypothetical protein
MVRGSTVYCRIDMFSVSADYCIIYCCRTNTSRAAKYAVEQTRTWAAQAAVKNTWSRSNTGCSRTYTSRGGTDSCRTELPNAHVYEQHKLLQCCSFLWNEIPSIFNFLGMVRNGVPSVFCSAEQPESRRN